MRLFLLAITASLVSACTTGMPMHRASEIGVAARCELVARSLDPQIGARIDAILDAKAAEGFAGQVALLRDGELVHERAVGSADLAGAIPVTQDTLFHVASISKYLTAVMALKAAQEGRIRLQAPVTAWAREAGSGSEDVTFADLLSHRSGYGSSYAAEAHGTAAAALQAIAAANPERAGKAGKFRYSNDGYDILGILLERVYAEPYEEIARERVLEPACVEEAGFWADGDVTDPRNRAQSLRPPSPQLSQRNYGMIGSSGLLISAGGLLQLQHALRTGRVLDKESLSELFAPRGKVRLGQATYGGFLIDHPQLGRVLSVRGTEDWGDNAYLNDYLDCGLTLAVVTSRGPAEDSGRPLYRDQLVEALEPMLLEMCRSRTAGTSAARL